MRESAKRIALSLLRVGAIGRPTSGALMRFGAVDFARKVSSLSGHVPREVPVRPPAASGTRDFTMRSAEGRDAVARALWWGGWQGFEPPMPDLFGLLARDAKVVLDVGAYSGLYSLIAASTSTSARVFAFEPFPPARDLLEANIALNDLGGRIRVLPEAVSDGAGRATLNVPPTSTGLLESASSLSRDLYPDVLTRVDVDVVTLDEFRRRVGVGTVDLIKLDVESLEDRVLRGAEYLLAHDRPVVFLEVLPDANIPALRAVCDDFAYSSAVLRRDGVRWLERLVHCESENNQILVPEEKRDSLGQTFRRNGWRIHF